jgi:hypothetical protein
MEGEKKRADSWALCCAAAIFVAYPFSLGPAVWIAKRVGFPGWMDDALSLFYAPLLYAVKFLPNNVQVWYGRSQQWWNN